MYELRYRGQSHELAVEADSTDPAVLRERFAQAHEQRYGYRDDDAETELVTIRVSVWGPTPRVALDGASSAGEQRLQGPAIHALGQATLFVAPGWAGESDAWGTIHLRPAAQPS